ncbi:FAD-dependent oxidoreductase, partial [Alphaproteobacteria bacterium]|nr:FAD-dependent oxidoreductase [Alphaproteobacteria bacterium]
MITAVSPIQSELILVGGGHANVQVLKAFAMRPILGLRITLISDVAYAPYSGMLPGFVAGRYQFEEM